MKKILYLMVAIFTFTLLSSNIYASSFTLTLDGSSTFSDEVSIDIVISSLTDFTDGFYGLDATLDYDDTKIDLKEITAGTNYTVTYDKTVSDRFVVLPTTGLASGETIATLVFENKSLTTGESTTISLTNMIGSDGEEDVPINGTVSKQVTLGNTGIASETTGIDFGPLKKGFSAEEADAVMSTIRITNTGTTTVTIDIANPSSDGPFGCYWFDNTAPIAPGDYIDVRLRPSESSGYATVIGSYEGYYVFTATNVSDHSDTGTFRVHASVRIVDNVLKGDMNKNGKIDLADIISLLRKYLNDDATPEEIEIGDMDDNGSIGLKDIIDLLKVYLNS